MFAYIYRDAFLCVDCAIRIIAQAPNDRRKPKGPHTIEPHDTPMHCARCALFLETPLTDVGREFVSQWCDVDPADIEVDAVRLAVAAWRRFYRN